MIDLKNISIEKAHKALKNKEYTVRDLVDAYLKNIEDKNEEFNIFLSIFSESIDDEVTKAQERFDNGTAVLMTGIPIAVKANINIIGKNTNSGSKILENYKSPYDATVIKKLKESSVIFLGYTNMDEFACGGSTENSAYGPTKNPLDITRVPGGSSGGSAAAVTASMSMIALGTDTGGSVRQPASFCGLVGVKPTYGLVSRKGAAAMGSSLDQICPVTKNISDSEIVLEVISGEDIFDMTSIKKSEFLSKVVDLKKKIAVPRNFVKEIQNKDVLAVFEDNIEKLKKEGYEVVDVDLDILKLTLPVYYITMASELSTNLSRIDGMRYGNKIDGENMVDDYFKTRGAGFGEEVKRRIVLGTYALSAGYEEQYYNKSGVLREKIRSEFAKVISEFDAVLLPTTPDIAFKIGENTKNPISMYLQDIFSVPANVIGIPAISIPAGFINTPEGNNMPLGLQILCDFEKEKVMYQIAEDFLK
jgi:aspartyl-tRNA(Asn)/glutamyl-tRNA(Gln) amidotransferase subunit A